MFENAKNLLGKKTYYYCLLMEGQVNKIKFRGDILSFWKLKRLNLFFFLNAIFEIYLFILFIYF
jgi:hypothetical protein